MEGRPRKVQNHGHVRWEIEWRDPAGKRHRGYHATQADAKEALRTLNAEAAEQPPLHPAFDPEATLTSYATHFLAAHRSGWKVRTYQLNDDVLRLYILPHSIGGGGTLGDVQVRAFTRGHGKAFLIALRDREPAYSIATLRIVYATLRSLLSAALDDELISANPVARLGKLLRRPSASESTDEVRAFDADQLQRFLTTAREHSQLYPLYLVGANTGLRLGELCGLQLGDLRLEQREALVCRSLGQESSMRDPEPGPTKTGRERIVELASDLVPPLQAILDRRPADSMARGWRARDPHVYVTQKGVRLPPWVFVTTNGTPLSQRNINRDFKRVLDKAKLPDHFTPHSLRHSFATLHLLNGAPIQWVQQQLGHTSIKLTVDHYGSWIRHRDQAAADRFFARVSGDVSGA